MLLASGRIYNDQSASYDMTSELASAPVDQPAVSQSVRLAKMLVAIRKLRVPMIAGVEFFDPNWDMILDLYVARGTGRRVSVSSLAIAAGVPATTALRWMTAMVKKGIFARVPDPRDGRRIFIALTPEAAEMLDRYFDEVAKRIARVG